MSLPTSLQVSESFAEEVAETVEEPGARGGGRVQDNSIFQSHEESEQRLTSCSRPAQAQSRHNHSMEHGEGGRGRRHEAPALPKKLFAIDTCWERKVSLELITLQGRPHAHTNGLHVLLLLWVFVSFCFVMFLSPWVFCCLVLFI